MKTILQRQVDLATAHGPRWVSSKGALATSATAFAALILGPLAAGVCGCTMLTLGSFIMILASALLVGNSAITALAEEREKKTLVFLRLTLLSAPQVMLLKMVPEFLILRSVLLVTAPVVLLCGLLDHSFLQALFDVALAGMGGLFAAASGIYLSTMFQSKSKAVVGGWIFKAVWLILTPLFDSVLAAVLVQTNPPAVFMSINPMASWWFATVPESATGTEAWLPFLALPMLLAVSFIMVMVAARRFDAGLIVGNIVGDEQIHQVYQDGWGPQWLQRRFPLFRKNPLFLRELAVQMRGGAGRWPGYAVFAVLFLAPFMYARMWATKDADMPVPVPTSHLNQTSDSNPMPTFHGDGATTHVTFTNTEGTRLVLIGHKPLFCFRTLLNQTCDVPLPASQLREVKVVVQQTTSPDGQSHETETYVDPDTGHTASLTPASPLPDGDAEANQINRSSLAWGFTGAVFMLLVYLGIRCSGFLATAITGERDRRSWEDLALTVLNPSEAMLGKVVGSLLLPLQQMTLTFPLLLFFVYSGGLSVVEMGFLYAYVVALAVASGMLGLWSSALSQTSHEAHARALFLGLVGFAVVPVLLPFACVLAAVAAVRGVFSLMQCRGAGVTGAWLALAGVLALSPASASPMTAVVSFMPSLGMSNGALVHALSVTGGDLYACFLSSMVAICSVSYLLWTDVMNRLHEPDTNSALRTQFAHAR